MAITDTLVVFLIGLLIGSIAIYAGARVMAGIDDFSYAVVTALIASIIWAIAAFLFGWIPFLGPLLALVAYIAVLNYRYPGGWGEAIGIALIAWIASLVILYVLAAMGITTFDAVGVPGT